MTFKAKRERGVYTCILFIVRGFSICAKYKKKLPETFLSFLYPDYRNVINEHNLHLCCLTSLSTKKNVFSQIFISVWVKVCQQKFSARRKAGPPAT